MTVPHTPETRGMMAAREFQLMKKTAFLINIGRGACVVLDDLVAALRAGEIAGAGLDVYEIEPLPPEHPLWTMPGVLSHRMWPASDPTCKNVAPSYSSKIASVSTRAAAAQRRRQGSLVLKGTDYGRAPFRPEFFARLDEEPDEAFYTMPRKVVHIDEAAIAAIKQGLPEVLPANGVVLDLLSSWRSHWPEGFPKQRLVGLGLNAEEIWTTPIWTSMSSTM